MPSLSINFESPYEKRLWVPINDGVMGGRSSGGPSFEDGNLIFSGVINTNGGGFSSIRRPVQGEDFEGAERVILRVRSDGREYKLRFRTNMTYRGRPIAFQKPIPATGIGKWETVTVDLTEDIRASLFGRRLMGAEFVPGNATETGIILADGQDGPFRLEVDWMKVE